MVKERTKDYVVRCGWLWSGDSLIGFWFNRMQRCSVAIWDLSPQLCSSTQPLHRFQYGVATSTQIALFNPRNERQILVYLISTQSTNTFCAPVVHNLEINEDVSLSIEEGQAAAEEAVSAAIYDRRGEHILLGTTKGRIVVYNATTLKLHSHCRQGNHQIKNFAVARRGDYVQIDYHLWNPHIDLMRIFIQVLTNSADRVIRFYILSQLTEVSKGEAIEPLHKFQEMVNKVCCGKVFICFKTCIK